MFESILFIKITKLFFFFIMSQENDNTIETSDFVVETEQGDHILQPDILENIQDAYDQIIENIGGKRDREDDQPEERQVRPHLEYPVAEQHIDQFVEFNDDWISESDSDFKSDPEYGEDGFDGWLKIMEYYDPNGEEYDSEYGY